MKIYKLVCNKTKHIYIGSSLREYLSQTLHTIEYNYNRFNNTGGYYWAAFDIIKSGDYSIELLEESEEYRQRLQHYKDLNEGCVNKRRAFTTRKEYDNKYREKHKEAISLRRKELYKQKNDLKKHQSNSLPIII